MKQAIDNRPSDLSLSKDTDSSAMWTVTPSIAPRDKRAPESFQTTDRKHAEHCARRGWTVEPSLGELPPARRELGAYTQQRLDALRRRVGRRR